jgi:hypothetical protein
MWERTESTLWAGDGIALTTVCYHAEAYSWNQPRPDTIDAWS